MSNGTACGSGMVCENGSCVACTSGTSCVPTNACHTGTESCSGGVSTCTDTGTNVANGTACGTNEVCASGSCVACTVGASCMPTNPCHVGVESCSSGPSCTDTGNSEPNGTSCGSGGAACASGTCVAAGVLSVVSGGGQQGFVDQFLGTLTLKIVDTSANPLSGTVVTLTPPVGAVSTPLTVTSNAQGLVTFTPRLGLSTGQQQFVASAPNTTNLPIDFTATAPPAGTIFTAVNTDHTNTAPTGVPGPGTAAHTDGLIGVVAAPDGTVYISDYHFNDVYKLTPQGALSVLAGKSSCGYSGDNGPAAQAQLCGPDGLALDSTNGILYIADSTNNVVRAVTLSSGVIVTFAGGGSAPAPGYGDGGPATSASLSSPSCLAIGPDGNVYISDSNHYEIRMVSTLTGIISTWMPQTFGGYTLDSCTGGCAVVWDASGNAYVSGQFSGGGWSFAYGVVRRTPGGTVTGIAGGGTSTNDGVPALNASFSSIPILAMDPAGNLYTVDRLANVIRRVEGDNSRITTVAGTGTAGVSGDYGPAGQGQVSSPRAIAFDGSNNMYVADQANFALRVVWGAGRRRRSRAR